LLLAELLQITAIHQSMDSDFASRREVVGNCCCQNGSADGLSQARHLPARDQSGSRSVHPNLAIDEDSSVRPRTFSDRQGSEKISMSLFY
jgi:hypothetical protein